MSLPERPTALVAIDDMVAFGVVRGLAELGYRVPQDLGLVAFNNTAIAELCTRRSVRSTSASMKSAMPLPRS